MNHVTLDISFGKDQLFAVDKILQQMIQEGHEIQIEKTPIFGMEDLIHYSITFGKVYCVYLFGHRQGNMNIINSLQYE